MIEMGKTYRTRDGREVRIYATDGEENTTDGPIHGAYRSKTNGWRTTSWFSDGTWQLDCKDDLDLIGSDPHGILPRHRELLAEAFVSLKSGDTSTALALREKPLDEMSWVIQAALIALSRLDREKGE